MIATLLTLALSAVNVIASHSNDAFHESLTLHPLPDGKLSVLFEFSTYFAGHFSHGRTRELCFQPRPRRPNLTLPAESHHSLTSPALLLPLQQNNVSEISISFVSGQWDQQRSGQAGPLSYGSGGGGGETRGWLRGSSTMVPGKVDENWVAVTSALGGLFCATLAPAHLGDVVRTFGNVYPPSRETKHSQSYLSFEVRLGLELIQ
jgi:phosphatidylinositol glycan class T